MPKSKDRQAQWTVTGQTVYRPDRAEQVRRAFALIVPERRAPRRNGKEASHEEPLHRPLRQGVQ